MGKSKAVPPLCSPDAAILSEAVPALCSPGATILSEDDLTLKELRSFDDLIKALNPNLEVNDRMRQRLMLETFDEQDSRRPVPAKEPIKPPKPTLSDIGVEAGVWKDDRNAEAIDSIASRGHGSKSAKRKAEDDGRSVRRAKAKEPGKKAYCIVSVTEKSGLNIKWKDKTSSFAGPDKVQLIGYTTFSRVKFKAIEKHNRFQRQTTNKINRGYIISLSRQRIKHSAATGASDETPFIHYTLRPTQVLKPLLAAAAQEDMLQELL
ncbi:hypothetical protein FAUST_222 [Fusarium austroamericanum]|uniref:Uncharacterized protein n=1 Tax=Fusarium austroamericanum TaxID=282268 RepID=A0AAN6CAT0_FUSAU|nr:hypothetical protein FAUST_222 [Fusarium austroamericanum]